MRVTAHIQLGFEPEDGEVISGDDFKKLLPHLIIANSGKDAKGKKIEDIKLTSEIGACVVPLTNNTITIKYATATNGKAASTRTKK
jgi:hypothetical protein